MQAQPKIEYRIINDTIVVPLIHPILRFNVELINHSETNFLLYGFRNSGIEAPEIDSTLTIDTWLESGSSNGVYIQAQGGKRAKIWPNVNSSHEEDLAGSFQIIRDKLVKKSVEKLEVLNGFASKRIEMVVDLTDCGPLDRGIYNFYLIYSSGLLTEKILGNILKQNEAELKAVAFRGYLISTQGTFVIE